MIYLKFYSKIRHNLSSYIKKQLELRNEQAFDLNDHLGSLKQAANNEKDLFEKQITRP